MDAKNYDDGPDVILVDDDGPDVVLVEDETADYPPEYRAAVRRANGFTDGE